MTRFLCGARSAVATLCALLAAVSVQAEEGSLKGVMSWEGHGRVLQIDIDHKEFLGVFEGILYIETVEGAIDEAFVECSVKQLLDLRTSTTDAHGNCMLVQSGTDNIFARYECKGELGACKGTFTLTGGTGEFEGIEGSSPLVMRSPLHKLSRDLTDVENLSVSNGVSVLTGLDYRMKGGKR